MLIEGLYNIIDLEHLDNSVNATIQLNKDHEIFKGHFPGNPIMPGVCMIQIIKEITELSLDKKLFLMRSSNIKFMAVINPDINSTLNLDIGLEQLGDELKVKNISKFEDTVALKLSATFKIVS